MKYIKNPEQQEEFKPANALNLDIKIDVEKVKAFRRKNVEHLEEVLSFIWTSFAECECWAKLTPFQQYSSVEQCFLWYFATFPARLVCAAALAAVEEDPFYRNKEKVEEQMRIRSVIKRLALSMKFIKNDTEFTISAKDAEPALELLEEGLDKRVIVILFTEELYDKVAKKWGKFKR